MSIYILARDGKEIMRGTYFACMDYIHGMHSFSMQWALRWEGYSITEAK